MDTLKNVVSENRVEKIRLIDPEHYVIGGQPVGDWNTPNDNNAHYDLACTAAYALAEIEKLRTHNDRLYEKLKLANPVGMLGNSFDTKVFNHHWLSLNGEWIARNDYPLLYDYLLGLGYKPSAQQLIQLPDARGLVFRSQNKGRFSDVAEIGLGQYQADATQRVVGTNNWQFMLGGGSINGAFTPGNHSGYHGMITVSASSGQGAIGITFDNSRVVRTALEERVKAIGMHAQIFVGFGEIIE